MVRLIVKVRSADGEVGGEDRHWPIGVVRVSSDNDKRRVAVGKGRAIRALTCSCGGHCGGLRLRLRCKARVE